ncbi:MAG: cytochrome-c peroxidase [bacterium]|nr:cytochrome-c peroxidase [bacterium]
MTNDQRSTLFIWLSVCSLIIIILFLGYPGGEAKYPLAAELSSKERLGKLIYFDQQLSEPKGQSCSVCHFPENGFNGIGDPNIAVYEGAVPGRFGFRNPQSSAYASFSPALHFSQEEGEYIGGQFWDGRANSLTEQAKGPFLNPVEQNNPSGEEVARKVCQSSYADLFKEVYGPCACDDLTKAFDFIADAIAAYESSSESNRFSSKYDWYLKDPAAYPLSEQEAWGLRLFETKGNCSSCHPNTAGPYCDRPLFTDYTYDNLGLPKNPANPWYRMPPSINPEGENFIDRGLGDTVKDQAQIGKFKVPTLRNVAVAPPYGHNGLFKTLKEVIHFYNTAGIPGMWPPPEVPENVNRVEIGNLGLSDEEEDALIAFLKTLTDGYEPPELRGKPF